MKETLFILLLSITILHSQTQDSLKHKLKDVVVESMHQPVLYSDVNRSIELIDTSEISVSPVNAPQDYLNYSGSVELNQRGTNGVQADIGIRGGSFEQTLIMLDGIKIVDPQTGHHNLNLPISFNNLERIEIVKGGSSSIHGANAFNGIVNFKTKRNKFNSLTANFEGGGYRLLSGSVFGSYNFDNLSNNVTLEKSRSDGYRENTEYNITNISYGGQYASQNSVFDLFMGYTDKDFGANSFYTTRFPLQAEHTQTTFTKLSAEFGNDDLNYSAKAYWRNNKDEFMLDKTNPGFYKNNHMTNIYGGELDFYFSSSLGKTSLGGEFVYDEIESNNLGIHNRSRKGIFFEHQFNRISNFIISLSGFIYDYSTIGWKLWPGLEVGYKLSESLNIFANVGKAFRIPTYTELYYNDPITQGNPDLKYEETLNYEIGINYFSTNLQFSSAVFRREGRNLIDYVRQSKGSPWQAMNFSSVNTSGIEFSISSDMQNIFVDQPFNRISLKYSYLNSGKANLNYSSRYLFQYLKHQVIITIGHNFLGGINFNWFMRYEERVNVGSHFITDLKIDRSIDQLNIYIKATNLFNSLYNDIAGIPLPGRWIVGGVKFSI